MIYRESIMTAHSSSIATPHYLLLGDEGPIGPEVEQSDSVTASSAVYGFSSKAHYDRFCAASDLALRPYPLLKGHLRKLGNFTGSRITLIAIDPSGPDELELQTATAESVAQMLETGGEQVPIESHLIASDDGGVYQLRAVPPYVME